MSDDRWFWCWTYRPLGSKSELAYIKAASAEAAAEKFANEHTVPYSERIHVASETQPFKMGISSDSPVE